MKLKNPFKIPYLIYKAISRRFYRYVSRKIIVGHLLRTQTVLDYVHLVKYTYDNLYDNRQLYEVSKNVKERSSLNKEADKLEEKLITHKNQLIEMIMLSANQFELTTEKGEKITQDYLFSLDIPELIDKTEKLYQRFKRLDE